MKVEPHPAGLTGATIRLIDYTRPIRDSLRHPYLKRVYAPGRVDGWGFYFSGSIKRSLRMDKDGSMFDLRIAPANEYLESYSKLSRVDGYWIDPYSDTLIVPYVVSLSHGRGFLAAYGEGAGMWGSIEAGIYETANEAALAAHDEAERAAERERDATEGDY